MASYTMQLRDYIEAQSQTKDMSTRERIEFGRKKLFDFDYPIFDEAYRNVFETHFIRTFYMSEIGFETEGLFKFQLETWLLIHLPYFNQLWESELLQYNPLHNAAIDTKHNKKKDKVQNDVRDTVQDTKSDSDMKHDLSSEGSQENENSAQSETDNFGRKLNSNNPDNRLQITTEDGKGVIEYASIIDEDTENNKGKSSGKGTGKEKASLHETSESGTVANAKQNDKLESDINEVEDFIEYRVGKVGSVSYASLVSDYRSALLRIEQNIFKEMQELFMLVY